MWSGEQIPNGIDNQYVNYQKTSFSVGFGGVTPPMVSYIFTTFMLWVYHIH